MVGYILVVNVGSSSLKYSLYELDSANLYEVSRHEIATHEPAGHANALYEIVSSHASAEKPLLAVGYRIVHSGPRQSEHCVIDDTVLANLEASVALDPDHLPQQIRIVKLLRRHFSGAAHVACFDTAFHSSIPDKASTLALPKRLRHKGLRRYGFHGLSYEYILQQLQQETPRVASGNIVVAHLGSGVSVAAIKGGVSVDTTMGLTPASGLPMSTRVGDVDPNLSSYLQSHERLSAKEVSRLLNFQSGLLALGGSKDMKVLIEQMDTNDDAALAVQVFCYQLTKTVGAYAAAMGGLDGLVFTGGIGYKAPRIREIVCEQLEFFGVSLDEECNNKGEPIISKSGSKIAVFALPTDEAGQIARHTLSIVTKGETT